MEIQTLKYYLSLAEKGSFTVAAREHYVTQPAISIRLKKFQEELGTRLFEVDGRKIRFTEAGRLALEYSRKFIELEKRFFQEIGDLAGLKRGKLFLGTIDMASIYVLPDYFSRFHELYPGIEVDLEISSTLPLMRDLEAGKLDLAVVTLPVEDSDWFEVFSVYDEALIPVASPDHPLVSAGEIDPARLAEYPFISFQKESVTRRMIEDIFNQKGIDLRITMAIDNQEVIRNLVISGLGLSILPEWTVREQIENGTIIALNVRGLKMRRKLGLIVPARRHMPSAVRAFLGILNEGMEIAFPERFLIPEGG